MGQFLTGRLVSPIFPLVNTQSISPIEKAQTFYKYPKWQVIKCCFDVDASSDMENEFMAWFQVFFLDDVIGLGSSWVISRNKPYLK